MKVKEFFANLVKERQFRWYMLAFVSFIASFVFGIYNFTVGITNKLLWNFSISFYYLIITAIKIIILVSESKWKKLPKNELLRKRATLFRVENIFLLLIDLIFLSISSLLLRGKREVNMGTIPAIAMAGYTTYKIIMACVNYSRSKKTDNLALHGFKIINLKEAIVSIITLQNTLVAVFGDLTEMSRVIIWTSTGMFVVMVGISIFQFVKLWKYKKGLN